MNANNFGARLNTLRNQITELTSRKNFGNSTLTRPLVRVDGNNKIGNLQVVKLTITPNNSKVEKKLAEYT